MIEHRCEMDVGLCMALGRHPDPPGSEADARLFYRRIRRVQRRALRRVRASVRRIRRLIEERTRCRRAG